MAGRTRPIDSGRTDTRGRKVKVSGDAVTGRADAPPPVTASADYDTDREYEMSQQQQLSRLNQSWTAATAGRNVIIEQTVPKTKIAAGMRAIADAATVHAHDVQQILDDFHQEHASDSIDAYRDAAIRLTCRYPPTHPQFHAARDAAWLACQRTTGRQDVPRWVFRNSGMEQDGTKTIGVNQNPGRVRKTEAADTMIGKTGRTVNEFTAGTVTITKTGADNIRISSGDWNNDIRHPVLAAFSQWKQSVAGSDRWSDRFEEH